MFPDFHDFFFLHLTDKFISSPIQWRKKLFSCLWKSLEERSQTMNNAAFSSVFVLHLSKEYVKTKLSEELQNYIVEEFQSKCYFIYTRFFFYF